MYKKTIKILEDMLVAVEHENAILAQGIQEKRVFGRDQQKSPTGHVDQSSYASIIKKLEQLGDCTKKMDEIIFYLEAKVLMHNRSAHR